ncbi:thioesterase II family protein [Alteromonas stellipolaris]|uniref:thioesterase II family protein n=1 Tax=Alteromonas stellipolaris TaxID=233316 RepID=UPI001E0B9A6E|nr:alpha/beta fold hydrolase [Alteromonas stellipolaris]MBZ2163257.1 hypothetical protein [Alteromonas stellipolaris]
MNSQKILHQWESEQATDSPVFVIIPHAGAGASSTRPLAEALASVGRVYTVRLPGRESRFKESLTVQSVEVVADIVEVLNQALQPQDISRNMVVVGICSGAYIGFAVAQSLVAMHGSIKLFVPVSQVPPQHSEIGQSTLSLENIVAMGGFREEILVHDHFKRIAERLIKFDTGLSLQAASTIDCPLRAKIFAVFGVDDTSFNAEQHDSWKKLCGDDGACTLISGNHFLNEVNPKGLAEAIVNYSVIDQEAAWV